MRFIGEIIPLAGGNVPEQCLACDGREVPIAAFPALYSRIGLAYGSASAGNFKLPDLRGRCAIGLSSARAIGAAGGEETHVLTQSELPAHTHSTNEVNSRTSFPAGSGGGESWTDTGAEDSSSVGSDQPHNNMPPFVALNYVIFAGV